MAGWAGRRTEGRRAAWLLAPVVALAGEAASACSFGPEAFEHAQRKPTLVDYAVSGGPAMLVRIVALPRHRPAPQPHACGPLTGNLSPEVAACLSEALMGSVTEPDCQLEVLDEVNTTAPLVGKRIPLHAGTNCHWRPPCTGETVVLPVEEGYAGAGYGASWLSWQWSSANWILAKQDAARRPTP